MIDARIWIGFTIDDDATRQRSGRRRPFDPPRFPRRPEGPEGQAGRWPGCTSGAFFASGPYSGREGHNPSASLGAAPMKSPHPRLRVEDRPRWASRVTGVQPAGVSAIFSSSAAREREGAFRPPVVRLSSRCCDAAATVSSLPVGPVGARLFCPMIYRAIFLGPSLAAVKAGGMSLVFGMTIFAGVVECALARIMPFLRPIFPPEVAGLIILLIGLTNGTIGVRNLLGIGGAHYHRRGPRDRLPTFAS